VSAVNYASHGDVAVLTVNNPPVNALSHSVRVGLMEGLQTALADVAVKAIVVIGGGTTYIAGADIKEFGKPIQPPRLLDIQDAMEASTKPIVSAIHGTALGGGLEVALTCHYRVAVPSAKVGLPEVKLGLLPGAGGTQRLPRLVGVQKALELITSGDHIEADKACELGVIDEVVSGDLLQGAIEFARKVVSENRPLRTVKAMTDKISGVDPQVFDEFRRSREKKFRGLFAPWKIIECIEAACYKPVDEAFQFERDGFQECHDSPQRAALIHLFFAERAARKIPDVPADTKPLPIRKAAIIGAGTMGGGIAMCFANAGIPVKLIDISEEAVAAGIKRVTGNYATSVSRGSISQAQMDQRLALVEGVASYDAVADVDIVIEAVFEKMELKKEIFAKLDAIAPPHCILGSNTSSLDIDAIASATQRPDKVIGTHFFSPANVMKLLENVRGKASSAETIATVMNLGKLINKVPVLAGNCDGFIGNRMLQYYAGRAEFLLEEGCTPEQVDGVAERFGMPMGPLAMRDLAGMDVGVLVRKERAKTLPPEERFSPIVERLVEKGWYGQKTQKGFYLYEGRKRLPNPDALKVIEEVSKELGIERREWSDEEIAAHLFHPLVNEGAKILEDKIAIRASDIDITWVNGYGFPHYLGGPMFWGEKIGLEKVLETARILGEKHGRRWKPAPLIERLVKEGKGFSSLGD
jgi:3-hydroxyacyl-CoA dehydrogenase